MNCEEVDLLLARYTAGDLAYDEAATVRRHLTSCGECRASLEIYESLEAALDARSGERPAARSASRAIMKRLRRAEPRAFISSMWSAPVIIGSVVALSALLSVLFGLLGGSPRAQREIPSLTGWERFFTEIPELLVGTLSGETWLLYLVYSVLAAGFILAGSLVMLRFARDSR